MLSKSVATALLLGASQDNAFWRMQCQNPILTDRVDPLAQPGVLPAKHIHNIMGGSAFNQDATFDSLQKSECTSCEVDGDKSSYWVPLLLFQRASDGLFEQVAQKPAGHIVYYIPERGRPGKVETFPEGFVMLAGDAHLRNFTTTPGTEAYRRQLGVGFNCLDYSKPGEPTAGRRFMPNKQDMKNCVNGLRADIIFPSCWNGEKDSENHRDHVAYPTDVEDGQCPDTHPRRLVTIMFETLWDTAPYNDIDGQFVWSTGDPTGYGYHGDFMNGWDMDLLNAAVADNSCAPQQLSASGGVISECDTFTNGNHLQSVQQMAACVIPSITNGNFTGPSKQIAGCNPIQSGPAYATECHNDAEGAPETTASPVAPPTATSTDIADITAVPLIPGKKKTRSRFRPQPTTSSTPIQAPPSPAPPSLLPSFTSAIPVLVATSGDLAIPEITANPLVQVQNEPDDVKEVVVTVVETITQTVFDDVTTTVSTPNRHRRRHGHRHGYY